MGKIKREITDDPVVIHILNLLQQQKKTGKDLERALGLANGAVSKWKYSGVKSYKNHLKEIAEYLHVPVEMLYKEETDELDRTAAEKRLLKMYRKLDPNEQRYLEQTVAYMLDLSEFRKMKEKTGLYSKNTI